MTEQHNQDKEPGIANKVDNLMSKASFILLAIAIIAWAIQRT